MLDESLLTNDDIPSIPDVLPILPIKGGVIFPDLAIGLAITNPSLIHLIDETLSGNKIVCIVTQKNPEVDEPGPSDLYEVGVVSLILKMRRYPDDTLRIFIQGMQRGRIKEYVQKRPYLAAKVNLLRLRVEHDTATEALMRNVEGSFQRLVSMVPYLSEELVSVVLNISDPNRLADFVAAHVNFDTEEKQVLLETSSPKDRLKKLDNLLTKELGILELGEKIRDRVKGEVDKTQREYFLREQMKAIKEELGEKDEKSAEIDELRGKIEAKSMPEEARETAEKELDRLRMMPPAAAEYTVIRTYIDWFLNLPWEEGTEDNLDIRRAKRILNEDHYDLTKVKERILEYLAVRKLKPDSKGPILCFVGPPGVGKTSLGRSIARALRRKFVRLSLGGVRDEAEIRGHRRTYVGAMPGRILQNLRTASSNNPVFMLDEIDKVGADFRGDPSSALLEVLDPEQNYSFSDHYVEVPFDLSRVMFIATANVTQTIIPALRDRMEIIELPGYIDEEKLEIAKAYLIPRRIRESGLKKGDIDFTDDGIYEIIHSYTREAGVRNLEREIGSVVRKVARRHAEGRKKKVKVDARDVSRFLGPRKFFSELAAREGEIGVATGLAWTPVGGEILFVEATMMLGSKGLVLTGSLGDIMKESAQAALSFLRSHARELKLDDIDMSKNDLHIHIPSGAIPKDGPSAGLALTAALYSLFSEKAIDPKIAMTGEITLTGRVLPVGGIKEKVLGAKRAGITTVLIPSQNDKDLGEIPTNVRKGLTFRRVKTIRDGLRILFPLAKSTKEKK
ncbi:endopeptidase La [candidate division WOR-3 bacterium]|uniref:Lon protease n=1 Tax=candidate division WOR-3 bacterium TaxID=2052148 RepID=A0A9D5QD18_UNCW3|nr:endopeptidase La [candidate division WOR-3 bacterium]MBD3363630.1 endopeptidase La [candidate division WOR-3 bacterium]